MAGVDLDALRQLPAADLEPFTYRLGGRTFTAVRQAPTAPLAAAALRLRGADPVQSVVEMIGVIHTLTIKAQHRQLRKVLLSTKDPIGPDVVVALFWLLVEHYTPDLPDVDLPEPAVPERDWTNVIDFATRTGGEVIVDG